MNNTGTYNRLFIALAGILVLAACSTPPQEPGGDPFADPGTTPPPTITDPTVAVAYSASPPDADNIITLNVPGFAPVGDGEGLAVSQSGMFTVVEDGTVKGIVVEEIGGGTRAGADIAFVFDTTGSMGVGLTAAIESMVAFAEFLDDSGLDVQLGAVTFGDAFDTKDPDDEDSPGTGQWAPPVFDADPRPMFALTDDVAAFTEFVAAQDPVNGNGAAENAVGALWHAYNTLDWRPGAQCIVVVITDIYAWEAPEEGEEIQESFGPITDPWVPPHHADAIAALRGNCVVHVIGPDLSWLTNPAHVDMKAFTGAAATGGVFVEWNGFSTFDLTELPIADVIASGYLVRYRSSASGLEVRLVVDDGGETRGEVTNTITY